MTLLISHQSALEFWRSIAYEHEINSMMLRNSERLVQRYFSCSSNTFDLDAARDTTFLLGLKTPTSFVMPHANRRPSAPDIKCHTFKQAARHSFIDVEYVLNQNPFCCPASSLPEKTLVSLPEACFIQMANDLSLEDLIFLGFELCGSYSPTGEKIDFNRPRPLTTCRKLQDYLGYCGNVNGIKKARKALKYVCDNSASPMESILTMFLCLPYSMGGYAIKRPLLNYQIDLDEDLRKATNKSCFRCDLFWPEDRLAIEYDSDMHHLESGKRVRDISRKNILLAKNVRTVTITTAHLYNRFQFRQNAQSIARYLGKRLAYSEPQFTYRQIALRESMFKHVARRKLEG